ncbi:MAG: 50S ribosomal protein L11 methyltransferase [Alphaproteobacteria bacterium]
MSPPAAGDGPLLISCIAPQAVAEALAAAWEEHAGAVAAFEVSPGGDWRVEAYGVDRTAVPDIHASIALLTALHGAGGIQPAIGPLPGVDWVAQNLATFRALRIGRFVVRPSHDTAPLPQSALAITLDANVAFGTGEHATTRGCLLMLDRLARRVRPLRLLDLGTGTGILAMAMARLWRRPVHAVDIDPDSVRVAAENARANRLATLIRPVEGRSFAQRVVRAPGPFDLIVANILARPLAALAPGMAANLTRDGTVILSGLLAAQQPLVLAAFRRQGLCLRDCYVSEGWATLMLARRG